MAAALRRFGSMAAASVVAAHLFTSWRGVQWSVATFTASACVSWLVLFAAWAIWAVQLYPKLFSPLRHLPEPTGNSFWNGQFRRIQAEPTGVPMADWINSVPNDGLIRYKGLLNQERLLPTSPKALAEVLTTKNYDFQKPPQFRTGIGRILGVGVLLAEGDEHKVQRRNLMPAFAFRHIKDLYPLFWAKSVATVGAMTDQVLLDAAKPNPRPDADPERSARSAVIEVGDWASRATLDIIGAAGLGKDFDAIKDPDSELIRTYRSLFRPSRQARILALLGSFLPGWLLTRLPLRRNDDVHAAARVIRATCRDLIRRKQEKLLRFEKQDPDCRRDHQSSRQSPGSASAPADDNPGPGTPAAADVDILSVALESGAFSHDNLVDQLMTFLAAGHETTASALTWAIYMMCRFPEVQERLRSEVRERLPSPGRGDGHGAPASPVSSVDIDGMPYLNAFCNEVLRYFGPVPMTLREAARDTSILGHFVPRGTRVMLAPWAVNKSTDLWGPDAARFVPERWLAAPDADAAARRSAASGGASSNYAFLTFLHGPRSCIGAAFAKAEFACLVAAWVGRFEFELRDKDEMDERNVQIKGGITARPTRGLHVHAKILGGW